MESRELRAIKNLRSIRRCNSYGDSVLAVYGVCYRGAFYDDLASVVATVKAQQARIEELEGLQIDLSYQTEETHACYDKVKKLQARLENLEAARDSAILQAQCWKTEAMSQKASLHAAYQHITGSTGEPADWHGANPIIEALEKAKANAIRATALDTLQKQGQEFTRICELEARIEELEAFAQLVIEELDVAALDDCESGVASVNAKLAGQYLNDYRHTREATYKLRGKAAEILEGTDDHDG